jgi:two-component system OmpR family response regulator
MFPATLALVDDDRDFSDYLSQFLAARGIQVSWFMNSDELLCSPSPYSFAFYILDLMLPAPVPTCTWPSRPPSSRS